MKNFIAKIMSAVGVKNLKNGIEMTLNEIYALATDIETGITFGKCFDARFVSCSEEVIRFRCVAKTPAGEYIGWDLDTGRIAWHRSLSDRWEKI
jgi:hypothetical protein